MRKVVLVDEKGKRVGLGDKFLCHQNPLKLHSAVSAVIFNGNKMLLQKRSKVKPTWGGCWSNASCTHPYPGESYIHAAKRRLFEEMGIKSNLKKLKPFVYKAVQDKTWGEYEYDWIFVGNYEGDKIKPNPEEVEEYKWMDLDELKKDVKQNPDSYTPWFRIIIESI